MVALTRPPRAPAEDAVLKRTTTLCPECLTEVEGVVYVKGGEVHMWRECPEHGQHSAKIASERRFYWLRDEVPHPPPDESSSCCGPSKSCGPTHKSCIALLEITEACNLKCAACYAQSPMGEHQDMDALLARLDRFLDDRGRLDVLQISGGEPTVHPRFLDILDAAKARDIGHVMVNTNGIRLAEDPDLAAELKKRTPNLEIYLQLDGLDPATHVVLRGRDLLEKKRAALEACAAHGLPVTLVCTVIEDINDDELGELLKLALEVPTVRGISFQPATFAGRFELGQDSVKRATLGDVATKLEAQSAMRADDFVPLPCSDPNCCGITFLHRAPTGKVTPLNRVVNVDEYIDQLEDRIAFTPEDTGGCCGTGLPAAELTRVVIKPFMDAHTYDQARVDECCVHIIDDEGVGVSFCEYNVRRR
jgi:uncharacterized radical SAM superfamily Fe-S cluster-containing enzyme